MSTPVPPPGSEEPLPIDLRFRDEVFFPWEEACHTQEFPWEATPALRRQWAKLLVSSERLDREVGFLALSRCSNLSNEEKDSLIGFWKEGKDFEHIPSAAALRLLLSGASPHESLFNIYFADLAPDHVAGNPVTKTLLGMLCRHPGLGHLAQVLSEVTRMYCLGFDWGLNPSIPVEPLRKLAQDRSPWMRAAAMVNPGLPFDEALAMADPQMGLDYIGLSLRPEITPQHWEKINSVYFPEEPFMFVMLEHPAAQGKTPPALNWLNPSNEAIQYFSHQTFCGALWRWWNPLLTMPWLSDQLSDITEPGVLLSFLIYGAPREIFDNSPALDSGLVRQYLKIHPGAMMEPLLIKNPPPPPSAGGAGAAPGAEKK